jgi:hypothetical protein
MSSLPVIRGRLAGYLEDFAKSPNERRMADHRARPETKISDADTSTEREASRTAATVRSEALAQPTEQVAAPTPPLPGHLIDRLV